MSANNKIQRIINTCFSEKLRKIDVATAIVWYHFSVEQKSITISEINDYFEKGSHPKFNVTNLKDALRASKNVIKGETNGYYKPSWKYSEEMLSKFPFVYEKSEEILTDDTIIPDSIVMNSRGYIENLVRQINASYNCNVFDGCAVLMRRLLEILLIHSYEKVNRINDISGSDGFKNLSFIITHTINQKPFNLSKDSTMILDDFRILGNFSAHKIHYNCRRKDLDNVKLQFRVCIEELLYVSGIRV